MDDKVKEKLYDHYTSWRKTTRNDIHKLYIDLMLEKLLNDKPLDWVEMGTKYYDGNTKELYWSREELIRQTGWSINQIEMKVKDGNLICFK